MIGKGSPELDPLQGGFSLVEIAIVALLLLVAIGSLSSAVVSSIQLSRSNEETAIADDAARQQMAQLRTVAFANIFANFVAAPDFDVRGLTPRRDDPDGRVGEIIFPTVGLELREDVVDPDLGLPRDLNGDGYPPVGPSPDGADHSGDYIVLPVTIRLEWVGASGNRWTELNALLVE